MAQKSPTINGNNLGDLASEVTRRRVTMATRYLRAFGALGEGQGWSISADPHQIPETAGDTGLHKSVQMHSFIASRQILWVRKHFVTQPGKQIYVSFSR